MNAKPDIESVSADAGRLTDAELRTLAGAFAAMADYDRHPERSETLRWFYGELAAKLAGLVEHRATSWLVEWSRELAAIVGDDPGRG